MEHNRPNGDWGKSVAIMHLSIECPTPYTPDKVRQMWVIAQ